MQPRIFGPYEPIRRDYPIDEYLADLAGSGVTRSVYVQANWANDRFEDEVAWVQRRRDGDRLAARHRRPMPTWRSPTCGRSWTGWRAIRWLRGVRMQLHWHENPLYRFAARPDLCARSAAAAQRRAARRLRLELRPAGVRAADGRAPPNSPTPVPSVTFVLQHAGMLEDLSPAGRAAWRAGMARLAALAQCRRKAVRPRHLHPSQRPGAYRLRWSRETVRAVRRRALPVRLQLSDRKALDQLSRAGRRLSRARRAALSPRTQRDAFTTPHAGVYRLA